jgi:hypothetical protein
MNEIPAHYQMLFPEPGKEQYHPASTQGLRTVSARSRDVTFQFLGLTATQERIKEECRE